MMCALIFLFTMTRQLSVRSSSVTHGNTIHPQPTKRRNGRFCVCMCVCSAPPLCSPILILSQFFIQRLWQDRGCEGVCGAEVSCEGGVRREGGGEGVGEEGGEGGRKGGREGRKKEKKKGRRGGGREKERESKTLSQRGKERT